MHQVLRARLVVPVSSPPIRDGAVEVRDGRILAVHSTAVAGAVDLGDVALLPGLVNAHTHLEFSDVSEPLAPAAPFTAWLKSVISQRRTAGDRPTAIRAGLVESQAAGVAAMGEIATRGGEASAYRLGSDGPAVVAFHESLGLRRERIESELVLAREHLTRQGTALTPPNVGLENPTCGVSPHAPYSVHPELVRGLAELAREHRAPVAMHLAETRAELELLETGTGEFVEFLSGLGVWDPAAIPRGRRILDYLHDLAPAPRVLVVHGNYLDDGEIEFLARHPQFTVVYCPRTHAYFGRAPHRWREMQARGVRVALGTDSRASNPDLSVWKEARFLRERHPEVPPQTLLRMLTLDGATALGLDKELGSIEPGKLARFAVVPLASEGPDTLEQIWEEDPMESIHGQESQP